MGFQVAPTLIIFLVILGAGLMLCCGLAIVRLYGGDIETDPHWAARSPQQDAYMREVRERNWGKLPIGTLRNLYSSSKMDISHAPMASRYVIPCCSSRKILTVAVAPVTQCMGEKRQRAFYILYNIEGRPN